MSSFSDISALVNGIEIFDTHEHVAGFDWGFATTDASMSPTHPRKSLPHILMNDLLRCIIPSTGMEAAHLAPDLWKIEDAPAYWRAMQPALEELRGATVYTAIRRGLQELYGFEGDEITDDNWEELNRRVTKTYEAKGAPAWLLEVAERAHVKAMIQMAHLPYLIEYWPSLNNSRREKERVLVKPSLILEPFFWSGFEPDRSQAREKTMELLNIHPCNYEEHLEFMHAAVKRHKQEGGAAVKFICAYQRSLYFEEVSDDEARRLYAKNPAKLNDDEMLRLQNNLVWHLLRLARELELPVQIHTGYSTPTTKGDPEHLYNLVRHPEFGKVNFYFCHAGWPNNGALSIMARTYANVHFGFCWIPGLSTALATRMMDEMFDIVPANKMLVGMDCGSIESFYGTTVMTRDIIARVLARKVDDGLISRRAASTLAHRVLHDNAAKLFA